MTVHALKPDLPGDADIVRARVRAATMAAENVLHDRGVIPITSSDAQGMGRAGETVRRTFQLASVLKPADDDSPHDNDRVLRYLAKLTVNPALVHGLAHEVGTLQVGRLADVVLWRPAYFAAKPALVVKGGLPAWGPLGDPNAATDTVEPLRYGPQFGGHGAAPAQLSVLFTNGSADESAQPFPTKRRRVPVRGTRTVRLSQLVRNARLASVEVDPRSAAVTMDGRPLHFDPVARAPLQRLYFL
jgi:urease subunit alpha